MFGMFWYLLGTYSVTSLALFICPIKKKTKLQHPLFQKTLTSNKVLHISHRGGSRENLENTMQAFQHAKALGTNMLEMDVCFTKDKKVIVIHDSILTRLCGINKHTHDYNYSDLPKILDMIDLDFAHEMKLDTSTCKTRYFPLLEDVFKEFPQTLINVEIKTPNPELNNAVNDLIKKYDREDLTVWGARYSKDSDDLFNLNPRIARFFCLQRILYTYGLYVTGLLPFVNIEEDSIQIPLLTEEHLRWKLSNVKSVQGMITTRAYYSLVAFLNFISPPLISHLKKRGVFVVYWVLNNEKDFQRALNSGVNGIMTDEPTLLKQFLKAKQLYIE